ncbi:hypothetical protein H0H87_005923 [Tephrocybe sp. NHM501043]|nr:hypothetical protein H0H87_005923 [Tephrocybe sp. NHM501043]
MRLFAVVFAALSLVLPAFAVPAALGLQIEKYDGKTTGRYIVTLKPDVPKSTFFETTRTSATHDWTLINGFAGELSAEQLEALRIHKDVESISEDGVVRPLEIITQDNAPWGISRLSWSESFAGQNESSLDFVYAYDDTAGSGVDIYIVDTGVYVNHTEFGGRATWGATFGPYPDEDVHGHGTHCAGTAAGTHVGVAKNASIIAVKVLGKGKEGSGTIADIISGLNWVGKKANATGKPSVASMSLGGGASTAMDHALTNSGVHVITAAGNDNKDAANVSPARVASAITVGASNIQDKRAKFSNYGAVVDVFAPGEFITSSWISGPNATPHISGLVAYLIALQGELTPAQMRDKVQNLALTDALENIRLTVKPAEGTVNLLAQNGVDA